MKNVWELKTMSFHGLGQSIIVRVSLFSGHACGLPAWVASRRMRHSGKRNSGFWSANLRIWSFFKVIFHTTSLIQTTCFQTTAKQTEFLAILELHRLHPEGNWLWQSRAAARLRRSEVLNLFPLSPNFPGSGELVRKNCVKRAQQLALSKGQRPKCQVHAFLRRSISLSTNRWRVTVLSPARLRS